MNEEYAYHLHMHRISLNLAPTSKVATAGVDMGTWWLCSLVKIQRETLVALGIVYHVHVLSSLKKINVKKYLVLLIMYICLCALSFKLGFKEVHKYVAIYISQIYISIYSSYIYI